MSSSFGNFRQRIHPFCIRCKKCGDTIAAPVETIPANWFITTCPLCAERRRYLPAEVFQGSLSWNFEEWRRRSGKLHL